MFVTRKFVPGQKCAVQFQYTCRHVHIKAYINKMLFVLHHYFHITLH